MEYTPKKIFKLQNKWANYMSTSWERGDKNIQFIEGGAQGGPTDATLTNDYEEFYFNICYKILKTAQANGKDIDISLALSNIGNGDEEEERTFKLLLLKTMLMGESARHLASGLDKVYSFGQAVYHIRPKDENETTLNQILTIENMENPRRAFFDCSATSPTFSDGKFCGRLYMRKSGALMKMYKKLRSFFPHENSVHEIIDFWFKERKTAKYIRLTTGVYKREDLVDEARDMVDTRFPPKKGIYTCVTYVRVLKDYGEFLEKQTFPYLDELPLIFDYGGLVWMGTDDNQNKYESFPLGYHLRDAQILLNYIGSMTADIAKNCRGDKWIIGPEHIESAVAQRSADEINQREGALIFTGDAAKIRRESSQQLPPGLMQMFEMMPNLVQNLAGSYFDGNSSEIKAMSGVALDKMFNRVDLVQNPVIVAHLHTLNKIGTILKKMIPIYYTENRVISIRNNDGEIETIEINKPVKQQGGLTVIKNPIKNLRDNFDYQINAAPALRLQKQNVKNELEGIYQIYQPAIANTVDIYVKSLDIPNANEISRRLSVNLPQALIDYGKGTINYEQYQQIMQQQAAQQPPPPELQIAEAKMQAEQAKVQVEQFKAQTDRLKAEAAAANEHIKNVSGAQKVSMDHENTKRQQDLEVYKAHMQQTDDIIDAMGNRER